MSSAAPLQVHAARPPIRNTPVHRGLLLQRSPLRIGAADDRFEREADRAAEAVLAGKMAFPALSPVSMGSVQREEAPPARTNEEQYDKAGEALGEALSKAFLEPPLDKVLRKLLGQDKPDSDGAPFSASSPARDLSGAAAVGAVAALAANYKKLTHRELPVQLPEIPLDRLLPGLSAQITCEGPMDQPTKAMISFKFSEQAPPGPGAKAGLSPSEKYRAETARMAAADARFRAGMRYKPGSPEDLRDKDEQEAAKRALANYVKGPDLDAIIKKYPGLKSAPPAPGVQLSMPRPSFPLATPVLPGGQLKLTLPGEQKKKEDEPVLQRKAAATKAAATANEAAPAAVHEALRAPGQPLDRATRAFMEPRFGVDFSQVRVHVGSAAERSARQVMAQAYTVGNQVVFGAGRFDPGSREGRRLLAHELTHVVQQRGRLAADGTAMGDTGTLYRQATPQPKKPLHLSLYQWPGKDKKFFKDLATVKANEIGAKQFPTEDDSDNPYLCPDAIKPGPIPFESGADIVHAIRNAFFCTEQKVSQIHLFSHSWNYGIFGVDNPESEQRGLYSSLKDATKRDIAQGARAVGDIPTEALNQDAVFVMHGCGTAGGSDSFAQKLLAAIIGTSPKARVYGHSNLSICGQDSDWREFNATDPAGKFVKVNPYHKPAPTKT